MKGKDEDKKGLKPNEQKAAKFKGGGRSPLKLVER